MFIHRFSRVPIHAIINLSHEESYFYQFRNAFFERIDAHALEHEELIKKELQKYISLVASPEFDALRTSPQEY